jgi:hypothetical protein
VPGKTPQRALDNYLSPLRRSLACVTTCQFAYTSAVLNQLHTLTLFTPVAEVASQAGETFNIAFQHAFKVQGAGTGHKVTTLAYRYAFEDSEHNELVLYDWHPSSRVQIPHLHIPCAGDVRPEFCKCHIPTGRIAFEDFLLFLIEEFKIQAVDNYKTILCENRQKFRDHCSWYWEPTK